MVVLNFDWFALGLCLGLAFANLCARKRGLAAVQAALSLPCALALLGFYYG